MSTRFMTIGRQFGSNGRLIAQELSKRLGINFYDKDLIAFAAEHTGIPYEQLKLVDEKKEKKWRYLVDEDQGLSNQYRYEHIDEVLFQQQSKIIYDLADREDCIFVGRCADYVLKGRDFGKRVYLYAPEKDRIITIMKRYDIEEKDATALMKKVDKDRQYYYSYHTDQRWDDFKNYDLTLNTGIFSVKDTVDILECVFRKL